MAIRNRTWPVIADAYVWRYAGTSNRGNGKGRYMTVGNVNGDENRSLLIVDISDRENVVDLKHCWLRITVSPAVCGPRGGNICFYVERVGSFSEGSFGKGDDCAGDDNNAAVWPGPSAITADRVKYNPPSNPGTDDLLKIDLVDMVKAANTAGLNRLYIRLIAADSNSSAYDGSNANRTVTFYTIQAGLGKHPHMDIEFDDALPPTVPTNVSPATTDLGGPAEAATRIPTSFAVTGTFNGSAAGDSLAATEVQFYTAAATDDDQGNILTGTLLNSLTGTGVKSDYATGTTVFSQPIVAPASLVGTEIRGRTRAKSTNGKWGDWTRVTAMRVIPNNPPTAPTDLSVDKTSPSPDYSGTHNDPDAGSTVSAVETQVWKQTAAGIELIENQTTYQPNGPDRDSSTGALSTINGTGAQNVLGGTRWTVPHTGRQLVPGESINRRHRTVDQYGAVGTWSGTQTWPVGTPDSASVVPGPFVKQDTLTPLLGGSFPDPFTSLDLVVYSSETGPQVLSAPGPVAVAPAASLFTFPYGSIGTATDLVWGQTVWVTVSVLVNGAWTPAGARSPVLLNSLPLRSPVSIDGAIVSPATGYYVVPTRRPRVIAPMRDPDLPNDVATRQIVRIWAHPRGGAPVYVSDLSAGILDFLDIPTGAMSFESVYELDVQYADSSGELGDVAALDRPLKVSERPTIDQGTPPDPHDPTATFDWVYASPSGKPQAWALIEVYGPEGEVEP